MDTNVKRREWVKTVAIIFLAVLLVLTFFSNTIMNASLPEVATQQVTQGTINAKIRASGTIAANETYNVKLTQTRKIESVKCKVGQAVNAGDVLFVLEAQESDELKQAKTDLETLELNYQKSLIEASNGTAQENRDVQKLRDAYNEALAIYSQYSTMDASQISIEKAKAEKRLNELTKESERAQKELTDAQNDEEYTKISGEISSLEATLAPLKTAMETAEKALEDMGAHVPGRSETSKSLKQRVKDTQDQIDTILKRNNGSDGRYAELVAKYEADYLLLQEISGSRADIMEAYYQNIDLLIDKLVSSGKEKDESSARTTAERLQEAYASLKGYYEEVSDLQAELAKYKAQLTYAEAREAYDEADSNTETLRSRYNALKAAIERLEINVENAKNAVDDQTEKVSDLGKAADNAAAVKTAKTALEDKLFEVNQGDTAALDMQAAKKAIEDKKADIEKLTKDADAQEVTAKVGGTIASVNVTAGGTASADNPLATINQTDRGFTVKISITNEQAKKVKVGDTAELVNYWGDATATLETIGNDPQNPQKNRQLTFRLTGSDIQPDSNITLAIGQKSASYDAIVPTSAIRTDNNGSFVLAIVSKSTPLSTRYTATRVDVQVLASDDKSSAVSGIGSGEFVITTSTKPIEAGTQVRLAENG